ncbi:NACHT domain-containing protein [Oculatella sp. FACHB-28]|uniref:NB-ARC domain-containing protein n=1 Tax=Oculatella sp. FACHB-28 TaxID=2692845 RepID=UPI0016858ADD|nr:NB-ARC domain-containing protein [Oculatella sp. FACHB-28]MBD2059480.1 NACHT domain-containing protein [Oculatella sp. FACHB-28]
MAKTLRSPQRYRGFVLTTVGLQKLQEQIKQLEIQTRLRQSPRTIAERVQLSEPEGIHPITVRKILNGENGVDKRSLQLIFRILQIQLEEGDYAHAGLCHQSAEVQPSVNAPATASLKVVSPVKHQDWSEAVDEAHLCGRVHEFTQLNQAVITEHCRFVQVLGIAGVGKTALATMLVKAAQPEFEFVIWRCLHHIPTTPTVLTSILQCLSKRTEENFQLPTHIEELKGMLIEQLQKHRCLLVFDHFDAVLCGRQYAGYCRPGYEAYGELLRIVAEVPHQSCLIITSREKPRAIGLERESYIRSLQLNGLSLLECQQMFGNHSELVGSTDEWRSLVELFAGNPLALKVVVVCIQDYFNGRISDYLRYLNHGQLLFGDLRDLLSQQFNRLSEVERELACYLALHQTPVSISQFCKDIALLSNQPYLLEGLDSLNRRSLLQRQGAHFSLNPMMQIYINECLPEPQDTFSSKPKLKLISHQN